jgi:hypothetical protein
MQNILDFDSLNQHFDKFDQNLLYSKQSQMHFCISTLFIKIPWISLVSLSAGHVSHSPHCTAIIAVYEEGLATIVAFISYYLLEA